MKNKIPVELPPGYLDFFKNLESWENEQQIHLSKKYSLEKVDIGQLLTAYNKPLIKIKPISINTEDYKNLVLNLLNFLNNVRPEISSTIESIIKQHENLDYDEILKNLLQENNSYFETLADKINIPSELTVFVFDHALRPFLRIFASPYQEFLANDEFNSWDNATICPICGSTSHFSRLRKPDGRRFMFCDRCFSEWEARYLQCVHCGNSEPGSIKYISVEDDESYQIYICDKCKGYHKTYDERVKGVSTDLFIANMETIYLDLLAQEKGYSNSTVVDETIN